MTLTILLFCISLLTCVAAGVSILYALAAGLVIFLFYGWKKGFSVKELCEMCLDGIRTARNILITFFLIGILTAMWRMAGTIPMIICCAASLFRPSLFVFMTFFMNCVVSFLTGTAFGTAATMGVICATMASAMGIPTALVGGAILSGIYFGDRCSPVSTSALLVAELTHTDIFENIRCMIKTACVPFLVTCVLYFIIGSFTQSSSSSMELSGIFSEEFRLHWITLLPALVVLILSLCRIQVKLTMLASILSAVPICVLLQGASISRLLSASISGYHAQNAQVASMINGGGVFSMVRVSIIVCLSSACSGIFRKTGLLDRLKQQILRLSKRFTPYGATLLTSLLASSVACNQTLAIMLTHQLCKDTEPDEKRFAIYLENTAVVVAALIPWSIAGGAPLAAANAPTSSILFAFFLYLLPLWRLIRICAKGRNFL